MPGLVTFPSPVRSNPENGNFREKRLILFHSLTVGSMMWQELEEVGPMASTVKKQNDECWYSVL